MRQYFQALSYFFSALALLVLGSCATIIQNKIPQLELLDVYEIPFETRFQETMVGGLSGIDYDKKEDKFFIISDDRAERNKARFYESRIKIKNNKIDTILLEKVTYLINKNQLFFDSNKINPAESTDPEDIRYNSKNKTIVWSSEGERIVKNENSILQDPSIFEMDVEGNFLQSYALPTTLNMSTEVKGPRRNGGLEGLSFNKDFSKLYASMEEPLYEDGARASVKNGGMVRFYEFDTSSKKTTNQFFYPLDPIAKLPNPIDGFAVNGVSAILMYDENKLLVVERSYSVGTDPCTIKIFSFDLKTAQKMVDLKTIYKTKKLVLNLDSLGIFTDNIEGITLGPNLPNGDQTLLLISDNNFSKEQKTQLFLFTIKK